MSLSSTASTSSTYPGISHRRVPTLPHAYSPYIHITADLSGGTAGCTIAGRLAEADPSLRVLVVESGQNNEAVPNVVYPAYFVQNLVPTSSSMIRYQANKSAHLNGRAVVVPAGGILGGGSSVNFMWLVVMRTLANAPGTSISVSQFEEKGEKSRDLTLSSYTRAQRSDFDAWNVPGWTTDELLPYLKKVCLPPECYKQKNPLEHKPC